MLINNAQFGPQKPRAYLLITRLANGNICILAATPKGNISKIHNVNTLRTHMIHYSNGKVCDGIMGSHIKSPAVQLNYNVYVIIGGLLCVYRTPSIYDLANNIFKNVKKIILVLKILLQL